MEAGGARLLILVADQVRLVVRLQLRRRPRSWRAGGHFAATGSAREGDGDDDQADEETEPGQEADMDTLLHAEHLSVQIQNAAARRFSHARSGARPRSRRSCSLQSPKALTACQPNRVAAG